MQQVVWIQSFPSSIAIAYRGSHWPGYTPLSRYKGIEGITFGNNFLASPVAKLSANHPPGPTQRFLSEFTSITFSTFWILLQSSGGLKIMVSLPPLSILWLGAGLVRGYLRHVTEAFYRPWELDLTTTPPAMTTFGTCTYVKHTLCFRSSKKKKKIKENIISYYSNQNHQMLQR